jgi:carotenoid cleavage dioxygenase-like enzyme
MLHSLRIKGGKVTYHNAWLQTPRLQFERARGRAYFSRLGELTGKIGIVKAVTAMARKITLAGLGQYDSGQANTAIGIMPDGRLWALHEASYPFEFRLTEQGGISSVGYETAAGNLTCAVSAHPKTGATTYNVQRDMQRNATRTVQCAALTCNMRRKPRASPGSWCKHTAPRIQRRIVRECVRLRVLCLDMDALA